MTESEGKTERQGAGEELLVDVDGSIATITLNRPGIGNAMSSSLLEKLAGAFRRLEEQKAARCVILRGAGQKAFCVGMDLHEMLSGTPAENYDLLARGGPLGRVLRAIEEFPFPVVAMIKGYAFGAGLELALTCDIRVASENSRVGMPPARLGIVYPPDGIVHFLREVGPLTTRKLFLTARQFGAREAKEMGLIDWVVPEEVVEELTLDIATDITKRAPLSLTGTKRAISILSRRGPREATSPEIITLVREAFSSSDAREGMAAFAEKRDPEFKGE